MTAFAYYTIACDEDGCGATFCAEHPLAGVTRVKAAACGWTHVLRTRPSGGPARSLDFCEEHNRPTKETP